MLFRVILKKAELKQEYLHLIFTNAENQEDFFTMKLATKNKPMPSRMLRNTARAVYGKPLSLSGYFIWKGTPEDIEQFFLRLIGNDCFFDSETKEMRSCHD